MKFAPVPVRESAGLIAAHTVRTPDTVVRKGQPIDAEAAARLQAAGITELTAVRLDPGDVGEDEAAARLAQAIAGQGLHAEAPFTGRCNLYADEAGLILVEPGMIEAVNAVDEALTVATLHPFQPVAPGDMVATVKIIPYAVGATPLASALAAFSTPPLRLAPYRRRRVGVVSTLLPGLKPTTIEKTLRVLAGRLAPAGAEIASETRVPHDGAAVAAALARMIGEGVDLVVIFGASAIADRRDVVPSGIEAAGGRVAHLGMPVDPGNLLLIGELRTDERETLPVIGAPGCARSPKENGFDWILHRLLADLPVTRADIVRLGVGGLLTEIVSRPQPRSGGESEDDEDA